MTYVVRVDNDYIAEGKNFVVQGESFVPFTGRLEEARRYKTYEMAKRATKRSGENMGMCREIEVIEIDE